MISLSKSSQTFAGENFLHMEELMKRHFLFLAVIFSFGLVCAGCGCGGDDDDDSGDDVIGDDAGEWDASDCTTACDNIFSCGGAVWYTDQEECNSACGDWLTVAYTCADCVLTCWVGMEGCVSSGLCMSDCALGPCVDMLEELDSAL
jgi:hypothetical protein